MLLTAAQPGARVDPNGTQWTSNATSWVCTVNLDDQVSTKFTATLTNSAATSSNGGVGDAEDNIDYIRWNGTCNCWTVLFENGDYDGQSVSLWLSGNNGTLDLSNYGFENSDSNTDSESDDPDQGDYTQWNLAVSSYRIYCF